MSKYFKKVVSPFIGGDSESFKGGEYREEGELSSDEQLSIGAPIEKVNPLGYNVNYTSAYFTALHGVIGTGIFASPAYVLKSIGSVGASYVLWISGFLIVMLQIAINIELVTYFKRRSGGQAVYLEQAYPKPKFLVMTMFAAVSVILSFSTSSAIAFAQYILSAAGKNPTDWAMRGLGVGVLAFCCIVTVVNSKGAMKVSNWFGFIKVVFIIFISITGLVVLGGHTRVKHPKAAFHNSWEGSTSDGNAIASSILKVSFSYGGTQYLFAIAGESNPRHTKNIFRFFLPGVMFSIFLFYILIVTAFYAGIEDVATIKKSGALVSSVFFTKVFGTRAAVKALDVFVALCALGHLQAVIIGQSRIIRECGRQGVLPYSDWWVTTKPWGTPVLPVIAIFIVNIIVMLAPPPGDAYNFVVDIGSFSGYIFTLLTVVGLLFIRRQRKKAGLGYEGFKVPLPIVILVILYQIFVIAMSFVPPKGTLIGDDVSFFYCTYALTTIGILILCAVYYWVWAFLLPSIYKYEHRSLYYTLDDGEQGHTVVKVPRDELEEWDAKYDSNGRLIEDTSSLDDIANVENIVVSGTKKL